MKTSTVVVMALGIMMTFGSVSYAQAPQGQNNEHREQMRQQMRHMMVEACAGKSVGAACSVTAPNGQTRTGVCENFQSNRLGCKIHRRMGGRGNRGRMGQGMEGNMGQGMGTP
jgi:hypothetical protein